MKYVISNLDENNVKVELQTCLDKTRVGLYCNNILVLDLNENGDIILYDKDAFPEEVGNIKEIIE